MIRPTVRTVLKTLTLLLLLSWLAAPVLAFGGMVVGAPYFGELPSPEERAESMQLLVLAGLTAFVAPALAVATAGSRPVRTVALIELGISLAVVTVFWLAIG